MIQKLFFNVDFLFSSLFWSLLSFDFRGGGMGRFSKLCFPEKWEREREGEKERFECVLGGVM